jgi:DNA-binding response OmpR family regulator
MADIGLTGGHSLDVAESYTAPTWAPVSLGQREYKYKLLLAFPESPQQPLTRERLIRLTQRHEDIFDRSIDMQVLRLRRKTGGRSKRAKIHPD